MPPPRPAVIQKRLSDYPVVTTLDTLFGLIGGVNAKMIYTGNGAIFQPYSSALLAVSGQTNAPYGLSLLGTTDAGNARAALGVIIGTSVQAFNSSLQAISNGTDNSRMKVVSGLSVPADYIGQWLTSTDGNSFWLANNTSGSIGGAVCQNTALYTAGLISAGTYLSCTLDLNVGRNTILGGNLSFPGTMDISGGSGEMLLARNNSGLNVLAVQNNNTNQGACSAIAYRESGGSERAAMGHCERGTGAILFPFTDAIYLESSFLNGAGPTLAKDILLEHTHLDSSSAQVFNPRLRIVDGGAWHIYKNNATAGTSAWQATGDNITITDAQTTINNVLTLTAQARPSSPSEGWIYQDSSDHHLYLYNGTAWKQLDN